MNTAGHVFAVKMLYRRILSLHRNLPLTLKALGDQYVKDEYRRHKNVSMEQAAEFMQEWKIYADMLQQQQKQGIQGVGSNFSVDEIDNFSEEQLGQLYALQQEATRSFSKENTGKTTDK